MTPSLITLFFSSFNLLAKEVIHCLEDFLNSSLKKTFKNISSFDLTFNKSGKYFRIVKLLFACSKLTNQPENLPKFEIFRG